jgi:FAD/FMN-containing dehydrogenase
MSSPLALPADSPYLSDSSGFRGNAERLFLPESEAELAALLREATGSRTPITISGAGTGLTGGRVPQSGWLVSLERFKRLDIGPGLATCGAGTLLRDVQAAAAATGQFYPPDPTEDSASIGGTIITNASGSRSFLYGPTRRYVRSLKVLLMSGETLVLQRGEKAPFELPVIAPPKSTKNTAGYFLRPEADYLDLFVGSEGTLGIVTEAELTLLEAPKSLFTGVVFFESDDDTLVAVDAWRSIPRLRMLEYLDASSLHLLRSRFPEIPQKARAALLIEQEADGQDDVEEAWLDRLETASAMEASWFATGAADRERFRRFRHSLPEAVNDLLRQRGLTKVASDFAVPIARNRDMLRIYRETLDRDFPGRYVIFGHIGDAHLHLNVLPEGEAEWTRAKQMLTGFAREAVALGGTVSAEHGLGKIKKHLLPVQFSADEIESMKHVKRLLDPHWLLGAGTLFPE